MAVIEGATPRPKKFTKAGALASNDFAGQCAVLDLALDTTDGDLWVCSATNGTTTSTWLKVGTQT